MNLCLQYVQLHPLVFPVFVNHACEFVPVQQVPTVPFQPPISLVLSHTLPSYHSLPFPNELSFPSLPFRNELSFPSLPFPSELSFPSHPFPSELSFPSLPFRNELSAQSRPIQI